MKKKWAVLMMVFLMTMPTLALANREHGEHGGHGSHSHEGFSLEEKYFGKVHFLFENKGELNLTEEQMEQIKNIKFDVERALIDTDAKTELAMLDVYQELQKDKPDLKKLDSIIDQKTTAKSKLAKTLVHSIVSTKAVLTAEQQAKAKEIFWKR